jgi:transposase
MNNLRFVGLDVHEGSITLAVADGDGAAPAVFRRIPHDVNQLVKALKDLSARATLKVVYEAGSAGFGLQRRLSELGIECHVVAPSRVPSDGRRSKTDAQDAIRLARFLRSGDLRGIYVPDTNVEGLRALTRAREDALGAQQRARGQLRQFLVREGFKWTGKTAWTKAHLTWVRGLELNHDAKAIVRDDYLREVEQVAHRVARLSEQIAACVEKSPLAPLITALQALRGVQLLTAATIAAEVGDFRRFASARHFMSYLGLVPREASSGERVWQGSITKAGNNHLRRVLGEAAWNYRFSGTSAAIAKRRRQVTAHVKHAAQEVNDVAERAQARLYHRWKHMQLRGKETNKIATAVARELAGFIWAIGRTFDNEEQRQQQRRELATAAS